MRVVFWLYGLVCLSLLWSGLVLKHSQDHLVSEYLGLHGSSDDSYGMHAFIHWRYVICHTCVCTDARTHGRKLCSNPQLAQTYFFTKKIYVKGDDVDDVRCGVCTGQGMAKMVTIGRK